MEIYQIIILIIATIGSAIIKNGVGIGSGIFLLPLLALVFPPKIALGIGAPVMLISDLIGIKSYWGEWDKKELLLMLPAAFVGILAGGYFINIIPNSIFICFIAVFAIGFSSYQIIKTSKSYFSNANKKKSLKTQISNPILSGIFGFLGGIASVLAHSGGLIMSIYLLQKRYNQRAFVGTLVFFFAATNSLKILTYFKIGILSKDSFFIIVVVSPFIILGALLGNYLNQKIPQEPFKILILIIIFIVGIRLLISSQ
jgi:uncharacterized membrane protein YfcA